MRQIDITDYQSAGGKGTLDFRLLRKNRMGVQMETMKEGDGGAFPQKGQKVLHTFKQTRTLPLFPNGSPFGDPGPHGDLFGDLGPLFMFWVPFSLF